MIFFHVHCSETCGLDGRAKWETQTRTRTCGETRIEEAAHFWDSMTNETFARFFPTGVRQLDLVAFFWSDFNVKNYVQTALYLKELKDEGLIKEIGVVMKPHRYSEQSQGWIINGNRSLDWLGSWFRVRVPASWFNRLTQPYNYGRISNLPVSKALFVCDFPPVSKAVDFGSQQLPFSPMVVSIRWVVPTR